MKQCPYLSVTELNSATDEDKLMPNTMEKYQKLIGDLRYLNDNTRPDVEYVTDKLVDATKCPTKRHWEALK